MRCNFKYSGYLPIFILFLGIPFGLTAQEEEEDDNPFRIMQGDGFYTWIDNSPNTFVTIDFPGEQLEPEEVELGFNIDGTLYQVLPRDYSYDQYNNTASSEKEDELLKYFQKYEQDYIEEVFEQKVAAQDEFFFNSDGKKFHLWYYKTPQKIFDQAEPGSTVVEHHYYLDFVANGRMYGIYTVSFPDESKEEALARIKGICETVDVFGYYVDLDALGYRISIGAKNDTIEYVDPKAGYSLDVPAWLNVVRSDNPDLFIATFPDNDNVKNAVSFTYYDTTEYASLDALNQDKILKYKMGDQLGRSTVMIKNELETPPNSTGVAYKFQQMRGSVMYEVQYVTYKTENGYLLVNFTATPPTYDKNVVRFRELLQGLSFEIEQDEDSED
jgi:hypothetical protein